LDNETAWHTKGAADVILDNLAADRKLVPMIVVMPDSRIAAGKPGDRPRNNPGEEARSFEAFENDLLQDVIPYVEANYGVRADRDHRAIAGLAQGGGQALNVGLKHLDTFAWVGAFSPNPNTKPAAELLPDPRAAAMQLRLLWVSSNERDGKRTVGETFHK